MNRTEQNRTSFIWKKKIVYSYINRSTYFFKESGTCSFNLTPSETIDFRLFQAKSVCKG